MICQSGVCRVRLREVFVTSVVFRYCRRNGRDRQISVHLDTQEVRDWLSWQSNRRRQFDIRIESSNPSEYEDQLHLRSVLEIIRNSVRQTIR